MDIPELLYKIARNEASPAELQAFAAHLENLDAIAYKALLEEYGEIIRLVKIDEPANFAIWEKISEKIKETATHEKRMAPVHRIHFIKRFKWAAAAVVLFALTTTYLLVNQKENNSALIATNSVQAPEKNRAMITLGNGKTVYLDQAVNGQLATIAGDVQLLKLGDGQIAYYGNTGELTYNTITNPRGSKVIDMQLTDGSHVWLNAGSSMTYPVPMSGKLRDVTLTGEAYFEVAKDAARPFIVRNGETKITVLGTHFNVKAYQEDRASKVTLLEGSVQLNAKKYVQLLKPGEQAIIDDDVPQVPFIRDADIKEALAWKNGFTSFHGAALGRVLNEISRWYDIDIEMKARGAAYDDLSFYIDVKRTAPLVNVLGSVLTDNKIRFEFDEQKRKLTILP